jgi:hypothetical protein
MGWSSEVKPFWRAAWQTRLWRIALVVGLCWLPGCRYSFQTVSLDPTVQTITIDQFANNADIVVPTLAQDFTEALRDQFIRQTRLKLVQSDGDMQFKGVILDYRIEPLNIQQNDQAAQNRLTITVNVKYENVRFPDQSWEQRFSNFEDFPQSANLAAVERTLITSVNEKLVQDIFNKALGNW